MRNIFTTAAVVLFGATLFSACKKNDYVPPATGVKPASYNNNFVDSFNSDTNGWIMSASDTGMSLSVNITNGLLTYDYSTLMPGISEDAPYENYTIGSDFALSASVKSDNKMGLVIGVSDTSKGIAVMIDNSGKFAVIDEGDANHAASSVIDWTISNAIVTNNYNKLEVDKIGNTWYGYINGTSVFQTTDKHLMGNRMGLIVANGTNGYADNFMLGWQ